MIKRKRPRRKGSKGKSKGSAFERKTCKQLSLWVSNGKDEDLFWRSAMSGGRATVGAKTGKKLRRQAGDISATSEEGCKLTNMFFVECKHYADLNVLPFLLGRKTGKLAGFWRVACREARKHDKQPMLIAKQNMFPTFVLVKPQQLPCSYLLRLKGQCDIVTFDEMLKVRFQ